MNKKQSINTSTLIDLNEITAEALSHLDARSQDIIIRRFGLTKETRETLESIGQEYSITRERVRQIEANAKKNLVQLKDNWHAVDELFHSFFEEYGGLLSEDDLVLLLESRVKSTLLANRVHFYLNILPKYVFTPHSPLFSPHWRQLDLLNPKAEEIVKIAEDILKQTKKPQKENELVDIIRTTLGESTESMPDKYIIAGLGASSNITKTVFAEWGLNDWPETAPRGVGDKAYSVMRRHGKPEHFKEITNMINEAGFDSKKANAQTVHNELIKDSRFVLVGRGLYGLKEWGYISGTVADVLESLLKKAQEPLTREELIDQVLEQRMVKKNTILLSLQNNKRFVKTKENRYTLKEQS